VLHPSSLIPQLLVFYEFIVSHHSSNSFVFGKRGKHLAAVLAPKTQAVEQIGGLSCQDAGEIEID
jgi:hypothetical protein